MPKKLHHTTGRRPPAGTAGTTQSSGNSAAGELARRNLTAPRCGPAVPPEISAPENNNRFAFGVQDSLTLSQLRYFMAVCETLSFTRAARKCGISQPALLRAIRKLENALGARLFRLEPARLRPTEMARLLRPQLQMILASAEAAKEAAGKFVAENPTAQSQTRKRRRRKD